MIDLKITDRHTGKTSEILEMCEKNPGYLFLYGPQTINIKGVETIRYREGLRNLKGICYKWFYFDEFFMQNYINYNDIIELDQRNNNIVLRGTPSFYSKHPPNFFIKYMERFWPEFLL